MKIYFATSIMVKLNNIFLVFILLSTKLSIVKKKNPPFNGYRSFQNFFSSLAVCNFHFAIFFSKSKIQMSHLN